MKFAQLEDKLSGLIDDPDTNDEFETEPEPHQPHKNPNLPVTMDTPVEGQDKVEITMFSVMSLLLVVVVFVAVYITTKKLLSSSKTSSQTHITSTSAPPEGFIQYQDEINGFSFYYPQTWELLEAKPNILKLSAPSTIQTDPVYILPVKLDAFLESRKLSLIGQTLQEFCEQMLATSQTRCDSHDVEKLKDYTSASEVVGKQGNYQIKTTNNTIQNLTVYFFKVDNDNIDTLVLVSQESDNYQVETILKTLTLTNDI